MQPPSGAGSRGFASYRLLPVPYTRFRTTPRPRSHPHHRLRPTDNPTAVYVDDKAPFIRGGIHSFLFHFGF